MKIAAISGYGVKGPACFLVEYRGRRILLDIGEGPEPGVRPDLSKVGSVDAIILSHAHRDHSGALDRVSHLGHPIVWCTPVVAELAEVKRFAPVADLPYAGGASLHGIDLLTGRVGHAPGAVFIRIGGEHGLLYSGDVSNEGALFPAEPLPRAAGLIVDASYGTYDTPIDHGIDEVRNRAARGPLLLPAPAGGRGLEMAVVLHESGYRVGLCPVHLSVAQQLVSYPVVLRAGGAGRLQAMLSSSAPLADDMKPSGVMIAATADGNGGLARALIDRWSEVPEVQFVFTGHLATGSKGHALVDAGRAEFIRWNVHPTFSHLRKMIEQTGAGHVLPAFLSNSGLASLGPALGLGSRLSGGTFELPD